ncbi:MAG: aldehyde ferredoxin oxidoreductase C-terminal domain-containing protein, partial [Desulfurococcaceae archaeon]
NRDGILPTMNFRTGFFEKADEISGETLNKTILVKREGCFACPLMCKPVVKGKPPYETDPDYGGPEYETIAAFGSHLGISDLIAIAYANQLCNAYGLDTISTGAVIAFAFELYEKGVITREDVGGLELRFGKVEAALELLRMIVNREGFGNILAEGVAKTSRTISKGSDKYALHVKGKEVPMHEPRGKVGVGLAYAISPTGADHLQAPHDPTFERRRLDLMQLGVEKPVDRLNLGPAKVKALYYTWLWWNLEDCLGLCKFTVLPHSAGVFYPSHVVEIVNAATGWQTTLWELMKASERVLNLVKAFNAREGFTSRDDTLPERFFEPLETGPRAGQRIDRDEFEKALKLFYEIAGWDMDGKPTKAKLYELDLDWVADELYKS